VNQLILVENKSMLRTQLLGEALDCDKLERLGRYEVQLDRKLERMLAMCYCVSRNFAARTRWDDQLPAKVYFNSQALY